MGFLYVIDSLEDVMPECLSGVLMPLGFKYRGNHLWEGPLCPPPVPDGYYWTPERDKHLWHHWPGESRYVIDPGSALEIALEARYRNRIIMSVIQSVLSDSCDSCPMHGLGLEQCKH